MDGLLCGLSEVGSDDGSCHTKLGDVINDSIWTFVSSMSATIINSNIIVLGGYIGSTLHPSLPPPPPLSRTM